MPYSVGLITAESTYLEASRHLELLNFIWKSLIDLDHSLSGEDADDRPVNSLSKMLYYITYVKEVYECEIFWGDSKKNYITSAFDIETHKKVIILT